MKRVTLIPGDGIGPEIVESLKQCVSASGASVEWDVHHAGLNVLKKERTPLPQKVLDSIKRNKVAIKGPITTPVGKGFRSVNVELRQALDLYANLRVCKYYAGVKTRFTNVDLVVVRENIEDLYAGIEFKKGQPETRKFIQQIKRVTKKDIRADSGISIKPISVFRSKKIVEFAFKYAMKEKRKKVTAVHKANIMKFSDGLFLETAQRVAKRYKKIMFEDRIVDNMCMQLVQKPELYDVLVLPNMYGDIVSDLCAGLVGGLGMVPGANIGDKCALFEPVHGSAPKYAGKNKVNPTAMLLAGVMMLRHIKEDGAADKIEQAVQAVIKEGNQVTYDLKPRRDDPTAVSTSKMTNAIVKLVEG